MKKQEADVCLVLEGTYPYVAGGVSTWVHQIITALPELKFALLYIGADKTQKLEEKYEIPSNVVDTKTMFLFDELPRRDRVASKRPSSARAGVYRAFEGFLEDFAAPAESERFTELVTSIQGSGRAMACANLWHDREGWELIQRAYMRGMSDESFLSFFWTVRFLVQPAWLALRAGAGLPKAKVYHSLCTGYAGVVAAVAARNNDAKFLLSEHGIYVRERLAEIQRADWVPETPSRRPAVFEELGAFRRLWVEFFKLLGRISYDSADHITSLFERNAEIQSAFGAPADKIEVVPNGIRPDDFAEVGKRRRALIDANPARKNVGFLGRVVRIKDVKTLVRAARLVVDEVPDAKFIIAGPTDEEPEYAAACAELAEQLGLSESIEFRGPMQRDELLVETDVMLLTSVSEGLPFVAIESFGASVPVVSTDVGSCGELVMGKADESPTLGAAGAVVPVGEPAAIARAVTKLLTDRSLSDTMGEVGRKRVAAHYDEADVVERYRELYTMSDIEGGAG